MCVFLKKCVLLGVFVLCARVFVCLFVCLCVDVDDTFYTQLWWGRSGVLSLSAVPFACAFRCAFACAFACAFPCSCVFACVCAFACAFVCACACTEMKNG